MAFDVIQEFRLKFCDRQMINIPADYSILSVGVDKVGDVRVWVMVDSKHAKRDVEIIIIGTNGPLVTVGDFIGTVVTEGFVWHVFTGPDDVANRPAQGFHYQTRGRG